MAKIVQPTIPYDGLSNAQSGLAGLSQLSNNQGAPAPTSSFVMTDGWYVAIACLFGIVTADTRIGPLSFGILGLALIYQLTLLVQHK